MIYWESFKSVGDSICFLAFTAVFVCRSRYLLILYVRLRQILGPLLHHLWNSLLLQSNSSTVPYGSLVFSVLGVRIGSNLPIISLTPRSCESFQKRNFASSSSLLGALRSLLRIFYTRFVCSATNDRQRLVFYRTWICLREERYPSTIIHQYLILF